MVNIEEIEKAYRNIKPFVHKTPLIHSNSFSKMTGAEVYLKAENLQKTGSFKVRGAFNKMVNIKDSKVIAASMGNHAQGVAFAAGRLRIQAKIVMPVTAPIVKEEATRGYGYTTLPLFLERKKLVVEGAGAVPLAALIENRERFKGKTVALIVSGGNIDFTLIDRIIHRGLVTSGRIGVFEVTVDDLPGSLHILTGVIASHRGNILNVVHDRLAEDLSVGKTRVVFTVETRGRGHLEEILSDLTIKGFEVKRRNEGNSLKE